MSIRPGMRRWLSIGAVLLLAAGTTLAGIQGTGFRMLATIGTVDDTSNGGLRVNGVPYDISHAHVTVNGHPGDISQLHAGHIVTARGNLSHGKAMPVADEIVLESDVRGEVTSVDDAHRLFSALGQTIQLTADTVLDSRIQDLGGLAKGAWVKVSAFQRSDGSFEASRVDLDLMPGESQVRGVVRALDRAHRTLRIGGLTVDYSAVAKPGPIAEGAIVTARGLPPQAGAPLFATDVEIFSGIGRGGERGDVRGLVTAFASPSDFEVNGQPVLADANTVYTLHGQPLEADAEVRVTGRFDAMGVLRAQKVQADAPKKPKPGPHGP